MTTDQYLRDLVNAEEAQRIRHQRAEFTSDIYAHLLDITSDVNRVRKAFHEADEELERPMRLTSDELKSKLCDVSNLLDDIYNELRGL